MYSSFEGDIFIKDYFKDRQEALINNSENKLIKYSSLSLDNIISLNEYSLEIKIINKKILSEIMNYESFNKFYKTPELLLAYLENKFQEKTKFIFYNIGYFILTKKKSDILKLKKVLDVFIKKFEIYKKLFDEYRRGFRKCGQNYKSVDHYLILSFCLLSFYNETKSLKFLNTALKINDNLCSVKSLIRKKSDIQMFDQIILMELTIIKNLMKKKMKQQ